MNFFVRIKGESEVHEVKAIDSEEAAQQFAESWDAEAAGNEFRFSEVDCSWLIVTETEEYQADEFSDRQEVFKITSETSVTYFADPD